MIIITELVLDVKCFLNTGVCKVFGTCLNQDLQDYRIFKPRNQWYECLLGFPEIMCLKFLGGIGMINHSDVVRKRTIHSKGACRFGIQ